MSGKITRTQDREAARHTAAIEKLQRMEARMVRAFRAFDKAREVVRRYDNRADSKLILPVVPGKLDVKDLSRDSGLSWGQVIDRAMGMKKI